MAIAGVFMLLAGGFMIYVGFSAGTDIQVGFGVLALGQGFLLLALQDIRNAVAKGEKR